MHIASYYYCVYQNIFLRSSRNLIYLEFVAMNFFFKLHNASSHENFSDSV